MTTLAGRADERRVIADAVRTLRTPLLAVHGEPGIGKTRLLQELTALAGEHGHRVLSGRGMDAFGDQELRLFVEPTVVVLDDLQWAPPDRIAELLRRPPRGSVLVALGFRTLPAYFDAPLEAANRHGELIDIPLGPLTPEEAEPLTDDPELYRLSGGNPFYLFALANRNTKAIAAAIGQELEALSEPARRLAFGAAVAGDRPARRRRRGLRSAGGVRAGGARRGGRLRAAAEGRSAPLPLPPPDRPARGLRHRRRGLAARRARARRRGAHATARPRRATSSTARSRATSRRSRRSSKPPPPPRPRSPPAGTPPRCGSSRRTGWRSSARWPTRWPPPATTPARSRC